METVSEGREGHPWVGAEWSLAVGPAHSAIPFPSRTPRPGHTACGLPLQTTFSKTGMPTHPRARESPGTSSHHGSGGKKLTPGAVGGHRGWAVSEALPLLSPTPGQLQYEEGSPRNLGTPTSSTPRPSITPTKKIELDRTIMPDGTIVTTVTTVQSRPRIDGKLGKEKEPGSPALTRGLGLQTQGGTVKEERKP